MAESNPLYNARTPFYETTSLATTKGLVTAVPLPAASLLFWMTTLTVSMGWIVAEAILPESEPTKNGFPYWLKNESLFASVIYIF